MIVGFAGDGCAHFVSAVGGSGVVSGLLGIDVGCGSTSQMA